MAITFLAERLLPGLPSMMRPRLLDQSLWVVIGVALAFFRQRATQLAGVALIALSAFGQAHAMAAFVHYGFHFRTDLRAANLVFFFMTAAHLAGMLVHERVFKIDHRATLPAQPVRERPGSIFLAFVLTFPIFWAVDLVLNVGYIPMLRGGAIVHQMYDLDYGRLYGYGVLMALSALVLRDRIRITENRPWRALLLVLLLFYCLICVMDGRRVFLMIFLIALTLAELRYRDWSAMRARFGGITFAVLVAYVGVEFWRQGGKSGSQEPLVFMLMATGVEYRDFAFVLQNLGANTLAQFDLLKSVIGGFTNWFILALFGVAKGEYVGAGSAYQIAAVMRSSFGIRIGLLAELYFDYALWGGLVAFVLGMMYSSVASAMMKARTEVGAAFYCLVLAVFVLGYVGQASATAGYYSVLLYLWLLWRLLTVAGERLGHASSTTRLGAGALPSASRWRNS